MYQHWKGKSRPTRLTVAFILWRFANAQPVRYRRYLDFLRSIPEDNRDNDWLAAYILLCGQRKTNPERVFKYIRLLKSRLQTSGAAADFEQFIEGLSEIMYPMRATAHGYHIPFKNRDCLEIAIELQMLIQEIEQAGYQVFINAGTLLGAARGQEFIPHDDDIDLCVILQAQSPQEAMQEFVKFIHVLNDKGILSLSHLQKLDYPIAKVILSSNVHVDFFAAWFGADDKFYTWPMCYGACSKEDVLPLARAELHGIELPAPRSVEDMMALSYGPNWRHPDPQFKFRWTLANRNFKELLDLYTETKPALLKAILPSQLAKGEALEVPDTEVLEGAH